MKNTLLFILSIGLLVTSACKKDNSDNESNNDNNTNTFTAAYYIKGTLDGVSVDIQQVSITSGYNSGMIGGSEGAQNPAMCLHSQGSTFTNPFIAGTPEYYTGIYKVFPPDEYDECNLSYAEYESILHTGSFSYASASSEEGAFVHYVDANRTYWSTEAGSQAGSTFNITSYTTDPTGAAPKIAKYEFDCKLYDDDGNVKTFRATWNGRAIAYQ